MVHRRIGTIPAAEFASALRAAVQTRGLSLELIRRQLENRGHRVSVATLSYWQAGRRRPERPESIAALHDLEDILAVPTGALVSLLPQPGDARRKRPRARVRSFEPSDDILLHDLAAQLGLSWDAGLERMAVHHCLQVRSDRTEGRHDLLEVLTPTKPGVRRYPLWFQAEELAVSPVLSAAGNCVIGESTRDDERNLLVLEVLLDRSTRLGEPLLVGHRFESRGNLEPVTWWSHVHASRIADIHLQLTFPREDPPRRVEVVTKDAAGVATNRLQPIRETYSFRIHEFGPGEILMRWGW